MKKICLITTGGTIAMKYDGQSGYVPALTGQDLYEQVPKLEDLAEIEILEWSNYPSPHIDIEIMFKLYKDINEIFDKRDDIDGIVVTHGSDILEETAFFLNVTLPRKKPVIITAAMRTESELGVDGPRNLLSAIRVACDDRSAHLGVLIVMNDEIHEARFVTKTATSDIATFKSPQYGSIGFVDEDTVLFRQLPIIMDSISIDFIEKNVYLIKAFAGCDDFFIKAALNNGAKGIVIEAFGRGNVPPTMVPGIKMAIDKNVPIVVVSRCFQGRALGVYAYEAGGQFLEKLGVIMGGDLRGQKAWILLSVALSFTSDFNKVKEIFDMYSN